MVYINIYIYIFQVGSWIPWTAIAGVGRSELGAMRWARAFKWMWVAIS